VTPEEFDTLNQDKLQYNYSWKYEQEPADEVGEKEISEDLMEETGKMVSLESFVPRYTNQAITFTIPNLYAPPSPFDAVLASTPFLAAHLSSVSWSSN
ncbi:hypothetical protein NE634_20025, partial [Lacrimispora saccharolytica]|nr:hypothetical protein [Lacrimispora saccharolytica]